MDFSLTPKTEQLRKRVSDFMDQYVFPIEKEVQKAMGESGNTEPQSLKDVRKKAKAEGLWNLFLPDEKFGAGLKNYEYAPLCELMGRSSIGARAFNCMAPDTGNMEILAEFGTPDQKKQWLQKCIDGEIRTCFSMTEPDTPGSDPTQLKTRAVRDGASWMLDGKKGVVVHGDTADKLVVTARVGGGRRRHRRRRRTSRSTDLSVGRQPMLRVVYPWRRRRPRFGRERRRCGRDANSEHRPDHRNASVFVVLGRRRGVDATTTPCASRGMPELLGDRGRREGQQAGRCRRQERCACVPHVLNLRETNDERTVRRP